MFINRYCSRGI